MNKAVVQSIDELFDEMRVAKLKVSGNQDYRDIECNGISEIPQADFLNR